MATLSQFHHQIHGPNSAPKLVFLHGVMGFASNFRKIARAFEDRYQVLLFDQRGHGRSFQPATGYGPEDMAGDLDNITRELGWGEIHLVGHSMGGRVALNFAATRPERVTRLVIEDIGPVHQGSSVSVTSILDQVPVPFETREAAKQWFDTTFLELFAHLRGKEGLAAYLYANITEDAEKRGVWRFYERGIREALVKGHSQDRWADIRALEVPTLLVRGEHSNDLQRPLFDEVIAANPVIQGVEILGAGHWVHSDQPDSFIEALKGFFSAR